MYLRSLLSLLYAIVSIWNAEQPYNKTNVLLHQTYATLADFCIYCLDPLGFIAPQHFKIISFSNLVTNSIHEKYLETRRAH